MELVMEIYSLTKQFPKTESYGLSSQMRRAAVSIPSNIAEGYRRGHLPEYIQFLSIGYGSGAELETQVEICKRISELKTLNYKKIDELLNEVMRMFNVLIAKLSVKRSELHPIRYALNPKL